MAEPDKNRVIRQVWYDADTGFGSIQKTYKDANKILKTITYQDVKEFLERQTTKADKRGYRSFNSYVANDKLEEIQIDIADFTISAEANQGYRYCLVGIDVFTKFAHAVAIKDKKRFESVRAMREIIDKIGIPKQIFRDDEGSWTTPEWQALMNEFGIHDMISSTPAPFAERMVQTVKNMVHDQRRGLEIADENWIEILPRILKKYNNTVHSTTKLTPVQATRDDHRIDVYFNIKQKAQFLRKYPPLSVGDEVRRYDKPEITKKGYKPVWIGSFKVLGIERIGGETRYRIDDKQLKSRTRTYGRNELLLVKGKETKDTV